MLGGWGVPLKFRTAQSIRTTKSVRLAARAARVLSPDYGALSSEVRAFHRLPESQGLSRSLPPPRGGAPPGVTKKGTTDPDLERLRVCVYVCVCVCATWGSQLCVISITSVSIHYWDKTR